MLVLLRRLLLSMAQHSTRRHMEGRPQKLTLSHQCCGFVTIIVQLTVVKGFRASTAEGVTREGAHSIGNEAIINGAGLILDVLGLL